MRYKLLGRSGLRVSELCLGTMTFGEDWGWGASKEESQKIFETFAAAGGNFIDTANNYTNGTSERYVGEFIHADRDHFVVGTKFTLSTRPGDPNAGGNHRKNMVRALEASLKRLNTEYVDLYWLHAWDFTTPVEEVMRGLDDLVRAGKVLYVGISDTPAWIISQANTLAECRGWSPAVATQLSYSLADRAVERDLLPMARTLDMAVLAWGLLEAGELTGKYSKPATEPRRNEKANPRIAALAEQVVRTAGEIGRPPAAVAINWVRQQTRANIIPILGARTAAQLRDNLSCLDFELTIPQWRQLDQLAPLAAGFPHDFLASEGVRHLIFGGTFSQIEHKRP
ncbi:MAG: aldo/keto reductase [Chloroflexota bacterium]